MDNQLQFHAQSILDKLKLMSNDSALDGAKRKFIERIQRNTVEFLDIYHRLQMMAHHEIISILNHDARNLITPIVGYAELLEMQSKELPLQLKSTIKEIVIHTHGLTKELDAWLAKIRAERQRLSDNTLGHSNPIGN